MTEDALRPVIVAKKTEEAHNIVSFELVDPNGAELPAFSAGSHVDVTIPGGFVRQHSLCNSSSERNRYVIGVWKDANSRGGSKALHLQVNAGDTLTGRRASSVTASISGTPCGPCSETAPRRIWSNYWRANRASPRRRTRGWGMTWLSAMD